MAIDLDRIDLEAIDLERIDLVAIDLERIDLEAIDLERIDLVTPSLHLYSNASNATVITKYLAKITSLFL